MTDVTVKLASTTLNEQKGLDPDQAGKMAKKLGRTHMAIVEFRVVDKTDSVDHDPVLKVKVLRLELAADNDTADGMTSSAEHLRELSAALYRRRNPTQLTIDSQLGDVEPDADEIIRRGKAVNDAVAANDNVTPIAGGDKAGAK